MPDQPTLTAIECQNQLDSVVLSLLIVRNNHRPMSVQEIEREIGKDTVDSLHRLHSRGLIHRLDDFVWATRAAVMADEIADA